MKLHMLSFNDCNVKTLKATIIILFCHKEKKQMNRKCKVIQDERKVATKLIKETISLIILGSFVRRTILIYSFTSVGPIYNQIMLH